MTLPTSRATVRLIPARITGRTLDALRDLLDLVPDTAPVGWQWCEVRDHLPEKHLLTSGVPAFYELCWKGPAGQIEVNCDRMAYHDGCHSWEPTTPENERP